MIEHFYETTCEKDLIINGRELHYNGIFRADELFTTINKALLDREYQKREKKTEELVTEEGRKTHLELRPYKVKTHFLAYMLKIRIILDNVIDVVEEMDGEKRKFQQGDIVVIFDAWILTDHEARWGTKPWIFFLKGFINKFVYIFPIEGGARGELAADTAYIYAQVKRLLSSYRAPEKKSIREEEVRKQMEEEIARDIAESAE